MRVVDWNLVNKTKTKRVIPPPDIKDDDMVTLVAKRTGFTKKDIKRVLRALFKAYKHGFLKDGRMTNRGFGYFSIKKYRPGKKKATQVLRFTWNILIRKDIEDAYNQKIINSLSQAGD